MTKLQIATLLKAIVDGTLPVRRIVSQIDDWEETDIRAHVDESFFNILKYSYDNVPYYHRLLVDHGLKPSSFTSAKAISKLPILRKDDIRNHYEELQSNRIGELKWHSRRSGGTTGEPIRSCISTKAAAYEVFSYLKGLRWMGWKPEMTMVKLFGGSLGQQSGASLRQRVFDYATNTVAIPAFEVDKNTIHQYYNELRRQKSVCLVGYASAIYNLFYLLKQASLVLTNVDLVLSTSEQMIDDWRVFLEDALDCPLRSYYGCGEINSLGYQIGGNNAFRIPREHVYIETDPDVGELLVTQLHNEAQPLLRYAIGDLGQVEPIDYSTRITNLLGRTADMFRRKDGGNVSPTFGTHSILCTLIPVKKYQYIQYSDHVIEFRYQMESGELTPDHRATIQGIVNYVMDEESELVFTDTPEFEVGASGKHRICVTQSSVFRD